jgi:hypothetical protein
MTTADVLSSDSDAEVAQGPAFGGSQLAGRAFSREGGSSLGGTHVGGLAAHEVGELPGQDAGEGVDADVVLGPVVHRGERDDVGSLSWRKLSSASDWGLGAVDNVFVDREPAVG